MCYVICNDLYHLSPFLYVWISVGKKKCICFTRLVLFNFENYLRGLGTYTDSCMHSQRHRQPELFISAESWLGQWIRRLNKKKSAFKVTHGVWWCMESKKIELLDGLVQATHIWSVSLRIQMLYSLTKFFIASDDWFN